MCEGQLELFAGNGIVNPDFTFGVEKIALFISAIEKLRVNFVSRPVSINNPDAEALFCPNQVPIDTVYFDRPVTASEEKAYHTDCQIFELHN